MSKRFFLIPYMEGLYPEVGRGIGTPVAFHIVVGTSALLLHSGTMNPLVNCVIICTFAKNTGNMVSINISIKKHLAEYLTGKFGSFKNEPVVLPDSLDIYHLLYDLLCKRPSNVPAPSGSLQIALPNRREGKKPDYYNYLSARSCRILESRIEGMFWAELHDLIDYNNHILGISYSETIYTFMLRYGIHSISEDAIIKNYYRWRDRVRHRKKKREYNKR